MKRLTVFISAILLISIQACSSSDTIREDGTDTRSEQRNLNEVINTGEHEFRELSDYLVRISGVTVTGSGAATQVRIRGTSSFLGGNEPLFVLDGRVMGQSYNSVSFVDRGEIYSVRVLKGGEASSYGVRGANGVVEITTRSAVQRRN
jgi:TonB-dependent SusC/RagA subfamily outer membrane receptor